jgi:hypothetical protein
VPPKQPKRHLKSKYELKGKERREEIGKTNTQTNKQTRY